MNGKSLVEVIVELKSVNKIRVHQGQWWFNYFQNDRISINVSKGSLHTFFTSLGIRKLCSRFVPRFLTDEMQDCKTILNITPEKITN